LKKSLSLFLFLSVGGLNAEPAVKPDSSLGATANPASSPVYKPKTSRLLILGGGHAAAAFFTYDQTQKSWGGSTGKFHFKNDWSGDYLAQNDEASHFVVGYVLTKQFYRTYRWTGFSPKKARLYGALESAFLLTFVEVPMDAFNSTQGFGVEDLLADYAGIGLGLLKLNHPGNWDIKAHAKTNPFSSQNHLFSQTVEQFDNYVFWGTYRPALKWGERQPLSLGVGYSVRRGRDVFEPLRELYFGVGTTIPDLVRTLSPQAAKYFEVLDFYYFNLNLRATIR
jgi:hypothetical protein